MRANGPYRSPGSANSRAILRALVWLRKAARQSRCGAESRELHVAVKFPRTGPAASPLGPACALSGAMYANGRGVPKDAVQAYRWLNLAAARGQADAGKNRDRVAKTMTPAQIAEAQRLPEEWNAK